MLFLYRRIEGEPFVWDRLSAQPTARRRAFAASIADLLAELHAPATLERVQAVGVALETPLPRVDGDRLRRDLLPRVDPGRAAWVTRVLDRVDHVLTASAESLVFLHGDLHGWNMVVDARSSRVIGLLDLERAGAGDYHFDLRYLPALAPMDLTQRVCAEYERATGRRVLPERVMAWNVLTDLGDALWRTEAGVEVVGGPVSRRIDGLAARLAAAGLDWGGGKGRRAMPGRL
jgi:aminoglycoside phosphotransferase (APT) family kinase protein